MAPQADMPKTPSNMLIQVSDTLPTLDSLHHYLSSSSPGCGAISLFVGITRNSITCTSLGKAVKTVIQLEYEGYISMALHELRTLCHNAKVRYPTIDRVVAVHILGVCPVGKASVIVGCNSPHRKDAIDCTGYLIDELKARVPIWKKEVYLGDELSVWKENFEWYEGRRVRGMAKHLSRNSNDDGAGDCYMNINKEVYLTITGTPIYFSEDWNTGIGGGLWSTGLAMAKYFQCHSNDVMNNLKHLANVKHSHQQQRHCDCCYGGSNKEDIIEEQVGLSALELGSGNGFLSVCLLAVMSAANQSTTTKIHLNKLVVTDMANHLELITKTFMANMHIWDHLTVHRKNDNGMQNEECYGGSLRSDIHHQQQQQQQQQQYCSTNVMVMEHVWGEESEVTNDSNEKYDFIFGSDLAYRNSLHAPLISSLVQFSHQHTLCLIGVTMTDTQPIFFDLLIQAGFMYERLADHLLESEYRGGSFGIFAIQRR